MNDDGAFAALRWGTDLESVDGGALATDPDREDIRDPEGPPSKRISQLVRRAIMVLESDCQGARRCLNYALTLLGPHAEEENAEDPVARGVFQAGGLARWQARRALTYIDTHLESRLDVPMLAKLVSFSKSHFSRAFKQSLGLPPMMYVKMRRIERAKALMTSTNQQLTEIALVCGFADQSHLNRSFRKVIGVSPGRWRRTTAKMTRKTHDPSDGTVRLRANGSAGARDEPLLRQRVGADVFTLR
jgi:AraC family transcriptional regulator